MAEPQGPLMSPGFWLHHAALEWRNTVERNLRIEVAVEGRDLARRAIRIVVDTDEQVFGPDSDALRDRLKSIAARRGGR